MVYRSPLPAFTSTVTGFVNYETLSSLSGSLVLTSAAAADSPAGTYVITPSGVSSHQLCDHVRAGHADDRQGTDDRARDGLQRPSIVGSAGDVPRGRVENRLPVSRRAGWHRDALGRRRDARAGHARRWRRDHHAVVAPGRHARHRRALRGQHELPRVHARRVARGADRSAGCDAIAAVGRLHHDRSSACRRDQGGREQQHSWYQKTVSRDGRFVVFTLRGAGCRAW